MRTAHARRLRLRELMTQHRLQDKTVAALLGRTPAYIRQWCNGVHPVSAPLLRLLELELEYGSGCKECENRPLVGA